MNPVHPPRKPGKLLTMAASPQLVTDPVCGMHIDPATAAGQWDHKGTRYYFCNPGCLQKFKADPEKYLQPALQADSGKPEAGRRKLEAESIEYTCPMHPEVVRDRARFMPDLRHGAGAAGRDTRGGAES